MRSKLVQRRKSSRTHLSTLLQFLTSHLPRNQTSPVNAFVRLRPGAPLTSLLDLIDILCTFSIRKFSSLLLGAVSFRELPLDYYIYFKIQLFTWARSSTSPEMGYAPSPAVRPLFTAVMLVDNMLSLRHFLLAPLATPLRAGVARPPPST